MELRQKFSEALQGRTDLVFLQRFRLLPSETPDSFRLFFTTSCGCGAAALLTLEIARVKTLQEVEEAMSPLMGRLEAQAQAFRAMSCETHGRMAQMQSPRGIAASVEGSMRRGSPAQGQGRPD